MRNMLIALIAAVLAILGASFLYFSAANKTSAQNPISTSSYTSTSVTTTAYTTIKSNFSTTTVTPYSANAYSGAYGGYNSTTNMPTNLPSCGANNTFYSVPPVSFQNFTYIVPLGNLNPSSHTFPSDHIYFVLRQSAPNIAANVTVVAPGNLTIYSISGMIYKNTNPPRTDYTLWFAPCRSVSSFFYHVTTLSNKLLSNYTPPFPFCNNYTTGSWSIQLCGKNVNMHVKAGEVIGTAGGVQGGSAALDFGTYDYRITPLSFANASRFMISTLHDACALDYYVPSIRSSLYALLGGPTAKRTIPPLCGTIAQDVAGTAQGDWFTANAASPYPSEDPFLALVHDYVNPLQPVFSVGTSMSASGLQTGTYYFTPLSSGLVNQDFRNVTSNGNAYCYQLISNYPGNPPSSFIIILQLVNPSGLRIERQSASSCGSGPWSFTSNHMDFVR